MLGLGKKSPPSLDRFPTDKCTVAQGMCDGRPMVVRLNAWARKYIGHPELPVRLGVTIAFNQPNEHGFCSPEEGARVGEIEDRLEKQLESTRAAFPVLAITLSGQREFVYYVRDREKASTAVDAVRAESPSHTIVYGFVDDADWSYYTQFA